MKCYHCAETISGDGLWQVDLDSETRHLCCSGCEAVMQAIVDAGLEDYYRFRKEPAAFGVIPEDLAVSLDELAVFDEPEISERYLQPVSKGPEAGTETQVDVNLSIEGMSCGACVWVLERAFRSLPGVEQAQVNFSSSRASVRFDPARIPLSVILKRCGQMGYQGKPFDAKDREDSLKNESRVFMQRLFVAGIATMQVMMYALPGYLSDDGDIENKYEQLLRWASLALTAPVLLYSAQPFLKGAYLDIKNRRPGMDVPVSLGILIAFTASVWATVSGRGETYFDSVAMFVFLLLGARYLEWAARRRAMRTIDDISACAPETAQRLTGDHIEVVPAVRLQTGDIIIVDSGERVPVDSRVLQGRGAVNTALLTGESLPCPVSPGDLVAGGALLTEAALQLKVLRRQASSTLSVIDSLIDRGASEKPQTVLLADRIASLFVSVLLVLATIVWLIWLQLEPASAGPIAISVLVVSCPCALSLATPAALAAATSDLLRHRMLVTRGHALETLAKVTDVVFDKTGTLTEGDPELLAIQLGAAPGEQRNERQVLQPGTEQHEHYVLQLAAAMESGSSHPYAVAFQRALPAEEQAVDSLSRLAKLGKPAQDTEYSPGHGVLVNLESGASLRLGSASWCGLSDLDQLDWQKKDGSEEQAASEVFLVEASSSGSKVVLARFLLGDRLRHESADLIEQLRLSGKRVHLLSGDRPAAVASVGKHLKLHDYRAAQTPLDKQAYVQQMQKNGAVVLMVGDGINDAPVLAIADVSLAAGDASSLARTASDVISLAPGLDGMAMLLKKSARTMSVMRQNLAWAVLYNLCAIPLAAFGFVPPWAAAVGMALSSLLVVANAQRLWSHDTE